MKRIGLTGGIASGKSLISEYFQENNVLVLDADRIYKNLINTNVVMATEIKKAFNLQKIDFQALAEIVFDNQKMLRKLNKIAHPFVIRAFKEQLTKLEKTESMVVLDIPLLFEAKMEDFCDVIICVYVDPIIQKERLMHRNNISEEEAIKRINSQMSLSEKAKMSDYVIDNSQDKDYSKNQFNDIFKKIKEKKDVS
jgi:dephospho-CoA kinase